MFESDYEMLEKVVKLLPPTSGNNLEHEMVMKERCTQSSIWYWNDNKKITSGALIEAPDFNNINFQDFDSTKVRTISW